MASATILATILSGGIFGAALTASGVYQPSVILSQLRFSNWHMVQTFLTATATSGVVVLVSESLGLIKPKPRGYSPLGLAGYLDGNVIGGAILGIGMALAGACPGTVFSQMALRIESGWWALQGGIVGGLVYTGFIKPYVASRSRAGPDPAGKIQEQPLTLQDGLGLSYSTAFVIFQAVLLGVVDLTILFSSPGPQPELHPVAGGLLIGATQLASIILQNGLVGTSGSFEQLGTRLWSLTKRNHSQGSADNIVFCAGVAAGSWLVVRVFPALAAPTVLAIRPTNALMGGFLMIVGSRIAGGCTSGHGISGMSLLSISSVVTIASAFASGALVAACLDQ